MINTVCFFEIPADDMDSLSEFYGQMFNWKFESIPGGFRYSHIDMGQELPKGGLTARQDAEHIPVNYVLVESIDASLEKAQQLGAKAVVSKKPVPGAGWFAVLHDPQGNRLGLWEKDEAAS